MKFLHLLVLSLALGALLPEAGAKRLGGGKSLGKQSSNVTQREASTAPAAPVAPVVGPTPASPSPVPVPAPAPRSAWGGVLGGMAAGLGLAWLLGHVGLADGAAPVLLLTLLALAALMLWRGLVRGRRPAGNSGTYAFQGAGQAAAPRPAYRPENVGNDASARPWEQAPGYTAAAPTAAGLVIGSALARGWSIPEGFDVQTFVDTAKRNFVALQAAWDQADMVTLRSMMTDGMLGEISSQLQEREQHAAGLPNLTEVQMLQAQLLGIETLGDEYMASIEFSGMIREDHNAGPSPFREVWNMTKPRDGQRGWLVAGVQALQ